MNEYLTSNEEWKLEHEKLLLQDRFDEAKNLKLAHLPKSIFRYRPLNDFTLENLQSLSLYLCDLESLNDPYECLGRVTRRTSQLAMFQQPDFAKKFRELWGDDISQDEIQQITQSDNPLAIFNEICFKKDIISLKDYEVIQNKGSDILPPPLFDRLNDPMKICSFSERNDSMLMWSHYSDQHKGVCIEYDFHDSAEVNSFLYPVVYSDDLFEFSLFHENVPNPANQLIISVTRKARDWHYEREWRLIYPAVEEQNLPGFFTVPTPKAIYLGVRYDQNSDYKRFLLERLADEFNIPLCETKLHSSQYKVIAKAG